VARLRRRVSAVDSLWLNMDRPTNLMVITSVVLLESVPDWERVLAVVRSRIVEHYPVFSQRPVPRPGPLGRHEWADDPHFDLERHVQRVTLDGDGTDADLQAYIEGHLARPFDVTRPLWEVHLVSGHGSGAALVFRIHHALADGMALTRVLLGLTEDAAGRPGDLTDAGVSVELHGIPPPRVSTTDATAAEAKAPSPVVAVAREGWKRLRRKGFRTSVSDAAGLTLRSGQVVADLLLTTNPSSAVGGSPGHRKRIVWTEPLPLSGLKQTGRLVGATLNDVLLSAVAGALHTYQQQRPGEPVDLVTMVPVNLRPLDEPLPRELGNRFALLFLRFPSSESTPLGRLALTKARMDWLKASPEAALTFALISVIGRTTGMLERRVVDFFADKAIGVTTNVAGPRQVRHLAGVPVTGVLGWVPGSGRHTLGFCIFTYADTVRIGILADEAVVARPEDLLDALEDEVDLLVGLGAAGATAGRAARRRS
jgi:diacylglycerol O-acyltransferase